MIDKKQFLQNHSINIIDPNKRAHKMTRMNTKFFTHVDEYNYINQIHEHLETETLFTVEIAESELDRMAEFESQVFNNTGGHYNLFETLMEQKEHEKFLKNKYPAVKKAYEHYSLMLKLAESGEL